MDKIVRTVYRQLYKKTARIDQDIALRSLLSCAPRQVYDQQREDWVPIDVARQAAWPESRVFLDNLIRRLNGGREFFLPDPRVHGSKAEAAGSHELTLALREAFVSTPFSMNQIGIAFAALRELAYLTDLAGRGVSSFIGPPAAAAECPVPHFCVEPAVAEMHHQSLIKGLSEALDADAVTKTDVRRRGGSDKRAAKSGGEETAARSPAEPLQSAQLLVAHPQLRDFFCHTVLILVRATPHESLALVLNKPLENEEGALMPVGTTMRMHHMHPIFARHLAGHTVMIGGPVSAGSLDSSVVLVHRVPGVADAVPLAGALWLDGSYDLLMRRLDEGAADPRDIIVVCGCSRWGRRQLEGEIRSGAWVLARCGTGDTAVDEFFCAVARHAGAQSEAPGEGRKGAVHPRTTAAWAWTLRALGRPYEDLARNQRPPTGASEGG